ncbi:MAG: LamG domain-containing protein, partial [Bacteroidales bacterium]|nr:LamG domain-containing protein [Bacteroidales bacterium]
GNSCKLYMDGNFEGETIYNGNFSFNGDLLVGWSNSYLSYSFFWDGNVDELQIWDKALTQNEICSGMHYPIADPGSETDLLGYYDFNEENGIILPDLSINANDGTLINMDPPTDWVASPAPGVYETIASVQDGSWDNPATWGGLVPGPCSNLEINHNVTLGSDKEQYSNINVETGSNLTMNVSSSLTVSGNLSNSNGTSGLTISSEASGTASLIENNGVPASVERYFSGNDIDWHFVSSPVSNALSGVFTDMYLQRYDESAGQYFEIIPQTVPLNPMQGYAVYSNIATMNTAIFEGNLNTGNLSANLTANNPYGWNLLGNPYPSSIDWDAVTIVAGMNNAVYYLDAATGNFLSYNGSLGGGSRYIPPMQGFFVSANSNTSFSLDNTVRTHTGADNFYKEGLSDLLVLKAEGNGFEDKTYIHFNNESTEGFDGTFDAYKIFTGYNDALPQIFTKVGIEDLSINVLPETESIVLGFNASQDGIYSIEIEELNDISTVILDDLLTGTIHDLKNGSYEFLHSTDNVAERFVVHFSPLSVDENKLGNIHIYSAGKTLMIQSDNQCKGYVCVMDILGNELLREQIDFKTLYQVDASKLSSGYYIVSVVGSDTQIIEKVLIW